MSGVEIRDLGEPEAVVTYPLGATSHVRLAGTVVSHHVLQPGWSWQAHAQPQVGTASCELSTGALFSAGEWASGPTMAKRSSSGQARFSTSQLGTSPGWRATKSS